MGNEYLVLGTLEKADWRVCNLGATPPKELLERAWFFKDQLFFEMTGGWVRSDES